MKVILDQSKLQNKLLSGLQPKLFSLLAPHFVLTSLDRYDVVESHGKPISQVYFPGPGMISVVARTASGISLETGLIGPEGMTGTALLYGVDSSPHDTFVQIPCRVLSLPAPNFRQALIDSPPLHHHLLRYAYTFSIQVAHTALCNGRITINQRLARWLLMTHDRLDREDIPLTHDFLAVMLGIRRAGVTTALRDLVNSGSIIIQRGIIYIKDRTKLVSIVSDFYGIPEFEYKSIMGIEMSNRKS